MIMSPISILFLLFKAIKSPDLSRTTAIGRNIPASIIRDPLRFSFFVSAPAGALSSFVCALHRFSDKCLDRRMAWPSSRPRDSSPRIICGEPSFFKATMTKSISILSFISCSREAGNTSRVRAIRARVRARFACARGRALRVGLGARVYLATMCEGPEVLAAFLPLFAMITPQFAFILHRGSVDRWKVALLFLCSWRYFITINSLFEGPAVVCLKSYTILRYVKCT